MNFKNRIANLVPKGNDSGGFDGDLIPDVPEIPEDDRKSVTDNIEGTPKVCGFCARSLDEISEKNFIAFTRTTPYVVICGSCVHRLEILKKLREAFLIRYHNRPWDKHRKAILKAMSKEDVSIHAARLMANLALRLSQRSAAIFAKSDEEACKKAPRIALVGRCASDCYTVLDASSVVTGMPVESTQIANIKDGRTKLKDKCNNDPLMIEHGILFVRDGYCKNDFAGPVVYCCKDDKGLPPEVEVIKVDGYDIDKL